MDKQTEMMEANGWIPASQAADAVGVNVTTIYRWIEEGKVEGTKPSNRWYVKVASLAAKVGQATAEAAGLAVAG